MQYVFQISFYWFSKICIFLFFSLLFSLSFISNLNHKATIIVKVFGTATRRACRVHPTGRIALFIEAIFFQKVVCTFSFWICWWFFWGWGGLTMNFVFDLKNEHGNLLRSIDNKTIKRYEFRRWLLFFSVTCSLLANKMIRNCNIFSKWKPYMANIVKNCFLFQFKIKKSFESTEGLLSKF